MEVYRFQEFAYLAIPVALGLEFFLNAKDERQGKEDVPLGSYVLDFLGFVFAALIPAIFVFTIFAVESKMFASQTIALARLDRYAVLFLFMGGGWWQIYMFTALRARRMLKDKKSMWYLWTPFIAAGIFISLLVLWVSPWNLKWISSGWFLLIFGILAGTKARMKTVERTMWSLAGFTFFVEILIFIWLDSIV
jgi:branched-subunit amino acid transport protein